MSDLTRYRIDVQGFKLHTGDVTFDYLKDREVLVPDSTLRDIADAWNELEERGSLLMDEMRQEHPELAALLDGLLTNES